MKCGDVENHKNVTENSEYLNRELYFLRLRDMRTFLLVVYEDMPISQHCEVRSAASALHAGVPNSETTLDDYVGQFDL